MATRIATGLATRDDGVDAFAEAAGRAALSLGGAKVDLAMVFAGAANERFPTVLVFRMTVIVLPLANAP